jgi:hypothetical protein
MKNLFIIFTILFTINVSAQLSETASTLKNSESTLFKDGGAELYGSIKQYSVNKWNKDHEMVVYEINQQVDAALQIINLMPKETTDLSTLMISIKKWSNGKTNESFFHPSMDWTMILYEYNNQIEAKNSY